MRSVGIHSLGSRAVASRAEEIEQVRQRVRQFCEEIVRPAEAEIAAHEGDRAVLVKQVIHMRVTAQEWGLWLPHMPEEFGDMGLGHVAMAAVSAEAAKTRFGSFALNAQAPDEGNMHTLLHWASDAQKEKYLRPLCWSPLFARLRLAARPR
jgi:acyl-CoA dehydrogenase